MTVDELKQKLFEDMQGAGQQQKAWGENTLAAKAKLAFLGEILEKYDLVLKANDNGEGASDDSSPSDDALDMPDGDADEKNE